MLSDGLYEILIFSIRVVFILSIPVLIAIAIGSSIISIFQASTTIQDSVLGYFVRVCILGALLYFFLPVAIKYVLLLAEMAYTTQ